VAGPAFIVLFYYLMYLHVDAFLSVIITVLYKRLGVPFAMLWMAVGGILGLNVLFNHFLAYKNRMSKKQANFESSDRYEGLSKEIKRTLRYRTKSVDELRPVWNRDCNKCD
jgi:hypothetical protein